MDMSRVKIINQDFKRILVLQGGGVKGKITSVLIRKLQEYFGGPLWKFVDLIVTNSTGSVQGSYLRFGFSGRQIDQLYKNDVTKMFVKYPWYKRLLAKNSPIYQQRQAAKFAAKLYKDKFGIIPLMGEAKTNIAMTAFNRVSKRTHVFMSWDQRHACQKMIQETAPYGVMRWSALDAIIYFGPIVHPRYKWFEDFQMNPPAWKYGRVFRDGGQGMNNSPIRHAVAKAIRLGWKDKGLKILSLGCGEPLLCGDFNKQRNEGVVMQTVDYPLQARNQSAYNQLKITEDICLGLPNRQVKRISPILDPKIDQLDGLNFLAQYDRIGQSLIPQIPEWFYK